MAQPVWKSGAAAGSSWTIKGVQEATRDAVREAAAQAELLIGDWIDQALRGAALAALHPSPPPATHIDVVAILEEIAALKASLKELATARPAPREPREPMESRAMLKELAELRATVQGLVQHLERQERQERHERHERPVVRHVLVEQRKPVRLPPRRGGDKDDRGP